MSSRLNSVVEVSTGDPPMSEPTLARRLPHDLAFRSIEPLVFVGDVLIIFLASVLTGVSYQWFLSEKVGNVESFFAIGVLFSANFAALTIAQRNYGVGNLINRGRQLRYVTFSWWFICLVLVGVAFTLKISGNFSRGSTLSFFAVGWGGLLTYRFVLARTLARALERGTFAKKKIIVITERDQQNTISVLADLRRCGYLPIKSFEITPAEIEAPGIVKSLQSKLEDIISTCQQETVDLLIVLIKWNRRQFITNLIRMLRVVAIPVHLLPDENVSQFLSSRAVNVGTTWTVELQRAPLSTIEQAFKRMFDLCAATVAIIILSPLLLVTALLIKLDSRGPVLFTQNRNGFNSRPFVIYKFSTMHEREDGTIIRQVTRSDSRVTRLGYWLRRTSIDELPQLFNVIIGDMSLVGPRPHAVAHNDEYQNLVANYAFRHHMKPGITGWAQINGYRGQTLTLDMMEHRVEHDIWYIDHWSPWLDLRILLKTLLSAHRQPMAY